MAATQTLILAFVAILIGVILIAPVTTQTQLSTSTLTVTDESVSLASLRNAGGSLNSSKSVAIANRPTDWRGASDAPSECLPGSGTNAFTVKNASGTALTVTTDYSVTSTGVLSFENTAAANVSSTNTTLVTYTYCPTSYLSVSWGRSVLNFVGGFFALAIMGIGVGLFYSVGRETGII